MHEEWIDREIRSFTSAVARIIRRTAPDVELPIAPARVAQDPPPGESAGVPPRTGRRNARRRRKHTRH